MFFRCLRHSVRNVSAPICTPRHWHSKAFFPAGLKAAARDSICNKRRESCAQRSGTLTILFSLPFRPLPLSILARLLSMRIHLYRERVSVNPRMLQSLSLLCFSDKCISQLLQDLTDTGPRYGKFWALDEAVSQFFRHTRILRNV